MKIQEQLDRLTGIVESLAASVVHHDNQLGAHDARMTQQDERIDKFFEAVAAHNDQIGLLIQIAEKHQEEMAEFRSSMAELRRSTAETDRIFQAYLKRLPPQ
jgi:DNA repair ATPase RecN